MKKYKLNNGIPSEKYHSGLNKIKWNKIYMNIEIIEKT